MPGIVTPDSEDMMIRDVRALGLLPTRAEGEKQNGLLPTALGK